MEPDKQGSMGAPCVQAETDGSCVANTKTE